MERAKDEDVKIRQLETKKGQWKNKGVPRGRPNKIGQTRINRTFANPLLIQWEEEMKKA